MGKWIMAAVALSSSLYAQSDSLSVPLRDPFDPTPLRLATGAAAQAQAESAAISLPEIRLIGYVESDLGARALVEVEGRREILAPGDALAVQAVFLKGERRRLWIRVQRIENGRAVLTVPGWRDAVELR